MNLFTLLMAWKELIKKYNMWPRGTCLLLLSEILKRSVLNSYESFERSERSICKYIWKPQRATFIISHLFRSLRCSQWLLCSSPCCGCRTGPWFSLTPSWARHTWTPGSCSSAEPAFMPTVRSTLSFTTWCLRSFARPSVACTAAVGKTCTSGRSPCSRADTALEGTPDFAATPMAHLRKPVQSLLSRNQTKAWRTTRKIWTS